MQKDLKALGAAIRREREASGRHRPEIARAASALLPDDQQVDASTIQKWERGQHQPTAARLVALARALHVSAATEANWMILAGHLDAEGHWVGAPAEVAPGDADGWALLEQMMNFWKFDKDARDHFRRQVRLILRYTEAIRPKLEE